MHIPDQRLSAPFKFSHAPAHEESATAGQSPLRISNAPASCARLARTRLAPPSRGAAPQVRSAVGPPACEGQELRGSCAMRARLTASSRVSRA